MWPEFDDQLMIGCQGLDAQEVARIGQVVEHCRNHAARPACRGGYDDAAGGILFGGHTNLSAYYLNKDIQESLPPTNFLN